ncbi:MAG: holo-ACP synthase [Pseudomonadota bacterium]
MIIGVGNDMVDIRRIEKTLDRFGDRFTQRIFTELEQQKAARRPNSAATLAKRFAAKEACSKALGTGFRRGVFWRDMGVINLPTGQPTLKLSGGALVQLQSLIPENRSAQINLTLTDDFPWAQAIVIISANPKDNDASG